MRNARPRRNTSLAIASVAVATLLITVATHEKGTGPGAWFGVLLGSFFTSIFSIAALVTFQLHIRWQRQLERGDRFLARWTVQPAEWAQFRQAELARIDVGRQNSVRVRSSSEGSGVEVRVAENALMVDDDFFKLAEILGLQYLPETPPCLEYNMVTRGKNGSVKWNIRFPVAEGAEAGARAVWDYVQRAKPARDTARAISRFRFWRPVGIVIAAICAPLFCIWIPAARGYTNGYSGAVVPYCRVYRDAFRPCRWRNVARDVEARARACEGINFAVHSRNGELKCAGMKTIIPLIS